MPRCPFFFHNLNMIQNPSDSAFPGSRYGRRPRKKISPLKAALSGTVCLHAGARETDGSFFSALFRPGHMRPDSGRTVLSRMGGKLRRAAFFPGTRDHDSYLLAGDHGTGCGTILKSQPSKRSAAAFSRKAGVRVATDAVLPSLPVIRFSYRSFRAGGAPCAHCTDAFFKTPGKPAFLRKKSCLGARFPCTERGRTVA